MSVDMSTSQAYNVKDAPAVTVTKTDIYYRASSLGMCDRRVVAARLSYKPMAPPERMQKVFDRGSATEEVITDIMSRRYGLTLFAAQEEVVLTMPFKSADGRTIHVIGHIDGMVEVDGEWWMVEMKRFGDGYWSTYDNFGLSAFRHYAYQISVYCAAQAVPRFIYAVYRGDMKTDKTDSDDDRLHLSYSIDVPFSRHQIESRVADIESLASKNFSEPVACEQSYPCPYFYLHDTKPESTLDASQLTKARLIVQLSNRISEMSAAKKKVQNALLSSLDYDENVRTFRGRNISVSVVDNPRRLDSTKVRALLKNAELDVNDYMTEAEGQHVRVSVPKPPKDD